MIDPSALGEFEPDLDDIDGARIVPRIDLPVVNEEATADQVIRVLAKHPNIFQRNGSIVKITREQVVPRALKSPSSLPSIRQCTVHNIRETISSLFMFTAKGPHGEDKSASCPEWLKNAVRDRGEWEHIRPLTGVVTWPAMRTDGSFISKPGYDEATGLYYVGPEVSVPECPNLREAQEAADFILEPVNEFPFQRHEHKSAWFALPLTLMVRYAIDYAPLWVFDAPTPGTGKTLLAELAVRMVTGGNVAKMIPATGMSAAEEDRKRIFSIAQTGELAVLVDNVDGPFGNAAFDAAVTADQMSERPLGTNDYKHVPVRIVWIVSGNNVAIKGDMQRRVLHCRVDPQLERPEERTFKRLQGELVEQVATQRAEYLRALMTVIRATLAADPPRMKPWGSFEGWSHYVRSAVLNCGLVDPIETRDSFRRAADTAHEARVALLASLHAALIHSDEQEMTTKRLLATVVANDDAREAAAELGKCQAKDLNTQRLGYVLRALKGRVAGGLMIQAKDSRDGQVWRVSRVGE